MIEAKEINIDMQQEKWIMDIIQELNLDMDYIVYSPKILPNLTYHTYPETPENYNIRIGITGDTVTMDYLYHLYLKRKADIAALERCWQGGTLSMGV